MKKKYTKKQILESIRYWKNQLKVMNEGIWPYGEDLYGDHELHDLYEQMTAAIHNRDFDQYHKLQEQYSKLGKEKIADMASKIDLNKVISCLQFGLGNLVHLIELTIAARHFKSTKDHDFPEELQVILENQINKILDKIHDNLGSVKNSSSVHAFSDFLKQHKHELMSGNEFDMPLYLHIPGENEVIPYDVDKLASFMQKFK